MKNHKRLTFPVSGLIGSQQLIWIVFSALFLPSCCAHNYYSNDPIIFGNVQQTKETNIGIWINNGKSVNGLNAHFSTAISPQFLITGSYTNAFGSCRGYSDSKTKSMSAHSLLTSFGYFKKTGTNFYFEGQIGAKFGFHNNSSSNGTSKHIKGFIQPGIFLRKEYFQIGFASRIGVLHFYELHSGEDFNYDFKTRGFIDPGFMISAGGPKVKIGTQFSFTFLSEEELREFPILSETDIAVTDPYSLTFFVQFNINGQQKNKKID